MDHSISLVTPEIMRERGAAAFDEGRGIDDHHMNPGAPAIAAVHAVVLVKHFAGVGTPP
jgi:hypothetical protein